MVIQIDCGCCICGNGCCCDCEWLFNQFVMDSQVRKHKLVQEKKRSGVVYLTFKGYGSLHEFRGRLPQSIKQQYNNLELIIENPDLYEEFMAKGQTNKKKSLISKLFRKWDIVILFKKCLKGGTAPYTAGHDIGISDPIVAHLHHPPRCDGNGWPHCLIGSLYGTVVHLAST